MTPEAFGPASVIVTSERKVMAAQERCVGLDSSTMHDMEQRTLDALHRGITLADAVPITHSRQVFWRVTATLEAWRIPYPAQQSYVALRTRLDVPRGAVRQWIADTTDDLEREVVWEAARAGALFTYARVQVEWQVTATQDCWPIPPALPSGDRPEFIRAAQSMPVGSWDLRWSIPREPATWRL